MSSIIIYIPILVYGNNSIENVRKELHLNSLTICPETAKPNLTFTTEEKAGLFVDKLK
jgi:hypothetical protein